MKSEAEIRKAIELCDASLEHFKIVPLDTASQQKLIRGVRDALRWVLGEDERFGKTLRQIDAAFQALAAKNN